jgi:glycosyltransferase involved in cell wall biosynthesis
MTTSPAVDSLVDIGIPTFGEPAFLVEAIESVFGQTLTEWRLTISENGPGAPAVAAAVERFSSDARVRHVSTGSNIGAAKNWTSLVQDGRAPYVALLNDDDVWEQPGFLARRVAFLEEHPDCAFVFSPCDCIDETGAVILRFDVDLHEGVQPRRSFLRRLYAHNLILAPTIVVRRTAYEAVGSEFNPDVLFFDYEMWLRIASLFEVGFLRGADARYRLHSASATRRHRSELADQRLVVLDAAESFLPPEVPRLSRLQARYIAFLHSCLDHYANGERRQSLGAFLNALRAYPLGPLDPTVARRMIRRLRMRRDASTAAGRADVWWMPQRRY